MASVAIVAIPTQEDYVWKLSSEKVPHMTLLFLGDITPGPELARIESYLDHVVSTTMFRFGMSVDHRGTLGPDSADVLFFSKDFSEMITQARTNMLANSDIRQAYNSVDQYPEWTPHLTMGYPATPAKPDPRDYPSIGWVSFDKIALWVGDYEGPEFQLGNREEAALAMAQSSPAEQILEHHGIKGMKWGVIRKDPSSGSSLKLTKSERTGSEVVIKTNPSSSKKVRVGGGRGHDIHPDAALALQGKQKAKSSGVHSLSNAELKKVVERMNLEQQLSRLSHPNKPEAQKFIEQQLKSIGQQKVQKLATR